MVKRYVDSVLGDDTFNGLAPTPQGGTVGPKKTIRSSYLTWVKGDECLLKRDQFYAPVNGFFSCTIVVDDFRLGAYGSGANPCLDGLIYDFDSASWFHEGNGLWSKKFGNPSSSTAHMPFRMWVGARNTGSMRADRDPGTGRSRTPDATAHNLTAITAALTNGVGDIWHPGNSTLQFKTYVYTGSSTIAPPAFYNGLAFLVTDSSTIGAGSGVIVQNCKNALVENIDVWGGTGTAFLATSSTSNANPTRDVSFKNCNAKYMLTGGFKAGPQGDDNALPRVEISNVLFDTCIADAGTSAQEQEKSTAYGVISGKMDLFQLVDGVKNCRGINCGAINGFHVGFLIGGSLMNSLWTDNCGFENCWTYADTWTTYNRAITTFNALETCYIRNCVFDGQNVVSQFSGAPTISGNVWKNMRTSVRKPGTSGWLAISALFVTRSLNNVGNEKYVYMVPTGVRIINNLVIDPVGVPVTIETFSPQTDATGLPEPVIAPDTITIANNVIFDRTNGSAQSVSVIDRHTVVGRQRIYNNLIYRNASAAAAKFARINGSNQTTLSDLNSVPDGANNIFVDPQLDLTNVEEPVLKKGSPLRRAGAFVGWAKDKKGRNFMIPPSIGPLEYGAKAYRKP